MNTEITEYSGSWLFYDGQCRRCTRWVLKLGPWLASRGFRTAPLQDPGVIERLQVPRSELLSEMKVLAGSGAVLGGVDALLYIARFAWWAWPFHVIGSLPGIKHLLRAAYCRAARRRHCASGACASENPPRQVRAGLPLAVLVGLALALGGLLPAWAWMWTLAFVVFAGCKFLTWSRARHCFPTAFNSLGYLLFWPGMDPQPFYDSRCSGKPAVGEWARAAGKALFGAILLWGGARLATSPLFAGWLGMIALVFLLHFGMFHLLALCWRTMGIPVEPLMRSPALATGLSDFWETRWNRGFNQLAHRYIFRPLHRRIGSVGAMLAAFLVSGLIHDLVISLPARGGYGWPTLYFLAQGLGVCIERTRAGRRLGLQRGRRGWIFMVLVTAGPVFWLFHPPFISNVILPFLNVLRAL